MDADESTYGVTIEHTQYYPHMDTHLTTIFVPIECALKSSDRNAINHA